MKILNVDYIVVGSGLAGLVTAYHASKHGTVALLSKSTLDVSNSYHAQGGIAVAMDQEDSPSFHAEDTVIAGRGLCDKQAVDTLVNDGLSAVKEFIELGMQFDKKDNELLLGLEGGHSKRRILHAGGDATGRGMTTFMLDVVRHIENITPFEFTSVVDLITTNNKCLGIQALSLKNNHAFAIQAKATFMATGGISRVFSRSTNPKTATGDGIALAYDHGIELRDLEFIQFHPSALALPKKDAFLISEAVRGEGAHLVDKNGYRFMPEIHPNAELAPRDIVAFSIFKQMQKTNTDHVYLCLKHLNREKIRARFKTIVAELDTIGLDLASDRIPVAPAAHYMVGGVKTDLNGETSMSRLFAIGELGSTGVMGANRLASNSLLECLVFARRAVDRAMHFESLNIELPNIEEMTVDESHADTLVTLRNDLSEIMNNHVGIVRTKQGLEKALKHLSAIKEQIPHNETNYLARNLYQLVNVCERITFAALTREESRGGHIREDFRDTNQAFRKHSSIQKNKPITYQNLK